MTLVARSLGLYQKYGVDGQLVDGTTASVGPLFQSGGLEVLLHGSALFSLALQGQNVKIVAALGSTSPFSLVARSDIRSVTDLKGKNFGDISPTGSVAVMRGHILNKAGMKDGDVQMVIIPGGYSQLTAAMIAGRVDAALLQWSFALQARKEPTLHVLDDNPTAGGWALYGYRFAGVKGEWADKNPEAVEGFVAGLIAATRALASDRNTYMTQLRSFFPKMTDDDATEMYKLQADGGYWSVNGGVDPAGIQRNLDYYRGALVATGASAAPATGLLDTKYAKAALDKLGGPVASRTDPASWYKK